MTRWLSVQRLAVIALIGLIGLVLGIRQTIIFNLSEIKAQELHIIKARMDNKYRSVYQTKAEIIAILNRQHPSESLWNEDVPIMATTYQDKLHDLQVNLMGYNDLACYYNQQVTRLKTRYPPCLIRLWQLVYQLPSHATGMVEDRWPESLEGSYPVPYTMRNSRHIPAAVFFIQEEPGN